MNQPINLEVHTFYQQFDLDTRERLRTKANRIRDKHKTLIETILEIGSDLLEEKELLPHGQFGKWLEVEFPNKSHQTLNNYMGVAREFGDIENSNCLENIETKALYLLSAKSTPPVVREIALEKAGTDKVTWNEVQKLKEDHSENYWDELEAAGEVNDPYERHAYRGENVIAAIGSKDTLSEGEEIRYREGSNCLFAWKESDPKAIFKIAEKDIESFPVFLPATRVQTLYGEGTIDFETSEDPAKVFVKMDTIGHPVYELPISAINVLSAPDTDDIEDKPNSVDRELDSQAENLGLPKGEQTLPDVQRNEGDPATLQTRGIDAVGALPPEITEGAWVCRMVNYKQVIHQLTSNQAVFPNCGKVSQINGRYAQCKWHSGTTEERIKVDELIPLPPLLQEKMSDRMNKVLLFDNPESETLSSDLRLENAICRYLGEEGDYPFVVNPNPQFFKSKVMGGYRILITRECPPAIIPEIVKAGDREKINRAILLLSIKFVNKQSNHGAFHRTLGTAYRVLWPMFVEDLIVLNFEKFDKNAKPWGGFIDCFRKLGSWGSFNIDADL